MTEVLTFWGDRTSNYDKAAMA